MYGIVIVMSVADGGQFKMFGGAGLWGDFKVVPQPHILIVRVGVRANLSPNPNRNPFYKALKSPRSPPTR